MSNRRKTDNKNKKRGQIGVQDNFQTYILLHSLGILKHLIVSAQTRYSKPKHTFKKHNNNIALEKKRLTVDENAVRQGRELEVFPDKLTEVLRTNPLEMHPGWSFFPPFIGEYKCRLREGITGGNKVKARVSKV